MSIESHPSFAIVKRDVIDGLRDGFTAREENEDEAFVVAKDFDDEKEFIGNEGIAVVPWTYYCVHTGDFLCLFPTGRNIVINGVTLVDRRGDDTLLHRHVDWAGLISQLGLEVSARVTVDEEEYAYGRAIVT